jgi:hypothetical protein
VGFIAALVLSFFHDRFEESGTKLLGMTPDILVLWITVALAIVAMGVYGTQSIKTFKKNKENK